MRPYLNSQSDIPSNRSSGQHASRLLPNTGRSSPKSLQSGIWKVNWTTRIMLVVSAYFCGWAVFYTIFMGFDYRYILEYLRLAWIDPGVLPTYINLGALATTSIATLAMCIFHRSKKATNGK